MQNRHKLPRERETIEVLLRVMQICILYLQTLAHIMFVLAPTMQQMVTGWLPSYKWFCSMATPACMMAKSRPWRRCRCFKHSYGKKQQSKMQVSETLWRESLITIAPDILFSGLQFHCNTCKCWSLMSFACSFFCKRKIGPCADLQWQAAKTKGAIAT